MRKIKMVHTVYAVIGEREKDIVSLMDEHYFDNRVTAYEGSNQVYDINNIAVVASNEDERGLDAFIIFGDNISSERLKLTLEKKLKIELGEVEE